MTPGALTDPVAPRARRSRPGERAARLLLADSQRGDLVAGADEAGRGCLAGPLVAAAVLLAPVEMVRDIDFGDAGDTVPPRLAGGLARLDDSKRVPKERRAELAAAITEHALAVAVVVRSAASVDRDGLHRSNLVVLGEALARVDRPGAVLLSDGFGVTLPDGRESQPVIGGDRSSAAIAAASVIAKTVRDAVMRGAAHERWPGHGFDQHVGYATPAHHSAIQAAGITPIHRRSFASTAYVGAVYST